MSDQDKNSAAVADQGNVGSGTIPQGAADTQKQDDGQAVDPAKNVPPEVVSAIEKRMQAEIDRRVNKFVAENNELKRRLEASELEKMSEKEKAQYELSKREEAIKDRENQVILANANFLKTKAVSDNGLPSEAFDFVSGRSEEEITESIGKLKVLYEMAYKKGVDAALKGKDTAPVKGAAVAPSGREATIIKINELKAQGKVDAALKLAATL
jgi:hypothetical protein